MGLNHNMDKCFDILDKHKSYSQGFYFGASDTTFIKYRTIYRFSLQVHYFRAIVFSSRAIRIDFQIIRLRSNRKTMENNETRERFRKRIFS